MRKIEAQMLRACVTEANWSNSNTCTAPRKLPDGSTEVEVFLHGHHIATTVREPSKLAVRVNVDTLRNWPTVTTKSRLRALGVNVTTRQYVTYLDGKAI